MSEITKPTRESRIRVNLEDYHEASSEYGYHSQRTKNASAKMKRALDNLKALGATAELEIANAGQ